VAWSRKFPPPTILQLYFERYLFFASKRDKWNPKQLSHTVSEGEEEHSNV